VGHIHVTIGQPSCDADVEVAVTLIRPRLDPLRPSFQPEYLRSDITILRSIMEQTLSNFCIGQRSSSINLLAEMLVQSWNSDIKNGAYFVLGNTLRGQRVNHLALLFARFPRLTTLISCSCGRCHWVTLLQQQYVLLGKPRSPRWVNPDHPTTFQAMISQHMIAAAVAIQARADATELYPRRPAGRITQPPRPPTDLPSRAAGLP
jgi:hypothetical protein